MPEDDLIELAARRARTARVDERTGFGNLLQLLRDLTRELARSRSSGDAFDLVVFETEKLSDPSPVADWLRTIVRDQDVVARIGSSRYALVVCDSESEERRRVVELLIGGLAPVNRFAAGRRIVHPAEHATATPLELLQDATAALREARELSGAHLVTWQGSPGSIN